MQYLIQVGYINMTDSTTNIVGFYKTGIQQVLWQEDLLQDPCSHLLILSRGQYLGITKLAYNPKSASRDELYKQELIQ